MSLDVVPVRGRRALSRFVGLPWSLYDRERHPSWVPPLRAAVHDALDERGNPFYRDAARELFLALRGGRPVGRIAAIENRRHNQFHGDRVGFFGFFEAVEDPEVARALLEAAGAWLRARGLERIRGPVSPSTNHECGVLVEGFASPPTFMTPWNPPFYDRLLASTGLERGRDLLAFWVPIGDGFALPERHRRVIERLRARGSFRLRRLDRSDFRDEAQRAWTIYNAAWERNWGFTPMSREEFHHMAGMLRHLLLDEFAWFAEVDGEPAGMAIGLMDYNLTLRRIPGGRLFPLGLPMLLRDRRRLRTGRALLLGVKAEYRNRGLHLLLLDELIRRGRAYGAVGGEASWILEDNEPLVSFFREAGLPATRRWRIYERAIPSP